MTTDELTKEVLALASEKGHRLFRANAGASWQGEYLGREPNKKGGFSILLGNGRKIAGLPVGTSDLIGISRCGLFMAIEIKAGDDKLTRPQYNFLLMVEKNGGITGVVRELKDFLMHFDRSIMVRAVKHGRIPATTAKTISDMYGDGPFRKK